MNKKYSLEDLSGTKIDYITFIKKEKCSIDGHARYLCRCDCNKEFTKRKDVIMKMRIKSCGCKSMRKTPIRTPIKPKKINNEAKSKDHTDLSGNRFGRLVVLECIGSDKHHKRLYRCLCDCGNEKTTTQALLKRKEVLSCGCLQKENRYSKNGLTTKRIYTVWQSMKIRCYNSKFKQYKDYGGRGIKICDEWLGENGLANFVKWAYDNGYDENAPRGQCTIDRIDNDKGYSPNNCRWVSMKEQSKNKRNLSQSKE